MKQKTIFPLILLLVLSFILVPMVNADCVELKYDDGTIEDWFTALSGNLFGVRFSLPAMNARLVKARFNIGNFAPFKVHVYDLPGHDLIPPFIVTPASNGWIDVPLNLVVYDDFYITLELISDLQPSLFTDLSSNQGRSYQKATLASPWIPIGIDHGNLLIRAVVCISPPVGGELLPNNVSTIGTTLIAVISIIGISTGVAFKKRRSI